MVNVMKKCWDHPELDLMNTISKNAFSRASTTPIVPSEGQSDVDEHAARR